MKFSLKIGSGINIDTDRGTVEGDSSGASQFQRTIPGFSSMSWEDLQDAMSFRGWDWTTSLEVKSDPEPEVKEKPKKKGVFSKSKDDEEKVGD